MTASRLNVDFLVYYLRYWPKRLGEARQRRASDPLRLIYVDVSVIFRHDSGTGIQRVVRAVMADIVARPPNNCRIVPVVATKHRPYRALTVEEWQRGDQTALGRASTIAPRDGDIFLGLELSAHLIPRHLTQMRWFQHCGMRIALLLYDLLPDQYPQYFTFANVRKFRPWLSFLLTHADVAICISKVVADQLRERLEVPVRPSRRHEMKIETIPMGGDLMNSPLRLGITESQRNFLNGLGGAVPTILMVGTVEPRKAHGAALDAMEWIWRQPAGQAVRLIIVGRHGWRSDDLEERLTHHPEMGKRLFRFDDVSDEYLDALYHRSSGLLMASYAEGFGLPILEALQSGLPVLARDIPVFRELERAGITYFMNDDATSLGTVILQWLEQRNDGGPSPSVADATWEHSAMRLVDILETLS